MEAGYYGLIIFTMHIIQSSRKSYLPLPQMHIQLEQQQRIVVEQGEFSNVTVLTHS